MSDTCGHPHHPQSHALFPPPGRIAVVVLAAGRASRMGLPKATLPLKAPFGQPPGEPACARIARIARQLGLGRVIVVLGHHAQAVRQACGHLADLALNPDPDGPMFSSVQVGATLAMSTPEPPRALLIWPADCPLIAPEALWTLLTSGGHWLDQPDLKWARIPRLKGTQRLGHPVLLSDALARDILNAPPHHRLDHLIEADGVLTHKIVLDDRHAFVNLNTVVDAQPYVIDQDAFLA